MGHPALLAVQPARGHLCRPASSGTPRRRRSGSSQAGPCSTARRRCAAAGLPKVPGAAAALGQRAGACYQHCTERPGLFPARSCGLHDCWRVCPRPAGELAAVSRVLVLLRHSRLLAWLGQSLLPFPRVPPISDLNPKPWLACPLQLARAELASLAAQALSLRNAYESFCWDVERLSLTTVNALAAAELDLPAELAAAAAELGLGKGADGVDMACCAAVACKLLGPGGILFAPALAPEAVATQRKGQGQHNSRVAFARTVSAPLGSMAFSMGMQAVGSTLAELFDALRERLGRPEWVGPASPELQAAAVAGLHASLRRQAGGIKAACCSYSAAAGELRAALACGGQPAVLGKAGGAPVQGGASPAAPHSPPNRQDSLTCRQAPAEAH
ncbi:hypothetical protein ABPG75_005312 [Micractinium tetrahymenae]